MAPYDMESSSGLIMSVIRILSNSKDDAERDVIRKKLEDCLTVSDQKLTKLVSEHHKDLRLVMQTFTTTSNNLESALGRLKDAKQRIACSRDKLSYKLDELRRLSDEVEKSQRNEVLDSEATEIAAQERSQEQSSRSETRPDDEMESSLMDNNVFNPRTSETSAPSLFKFSRSSYAICFEDRYKDLSI